MSAACLDLASLQPHSSLLLSLGPHAVDQALCLFGWDRTPEVFCRMASRMHGFEGDAENHCTVCMCVDETHLPSHYVFITGSVLDSQDHGG